MAGADGGRRGRWAVVELVLDRGFVVGVEARIAPGVREVLHPGDHPAPACLGLDIPIGLPESAASGREAERLARAELGPRRSSVFSTPSRPALEQAEKRDFAPAAYFEVSEANAADGGPKLSKQSYFIMPRIAEVDTFLRSSRLGREAIFEVHPEVIFARLAGRPLASKKTFRGRLERWRLLEASGVRLEPEALALEDDPDVGPDDLLDAGACAWAAWAKSRGELRPHPDPAPLDRYGLPMAIWY